MLFAFALSVFAGNAFSQEDMGERTSGPKGQQFIQKAYENMSLEEFKDDIRNDWKVWNCPVRAVYKKYMQIIGGYKYQFGLNFGQDNSLLDFVPRFVQISLPSSAWVKSYYLYDGDIFWFMRHPHDGERFVAFQVNGIYYVVASLFCGNPMEYVLNPPAPPAPDRGQAQPLDAPHEITFAQAPPPADINITITNTNVNNNGGGGCQSQQAQQMCQQQPSYGCLQGNWNMSGAIMGGAGLGSGWIAQQQAPFCPTRQPVQYQQQSGGGPPINHTFNTGTGQTVNAGGGPPINHTFHRR